MESLRYHQVENPFPIRQVKYESPSSLHELHNRLASTMENDDVLMEEALARRLANVFIPRAGRGKRRGANVVRFVPSGNAHACRPPQNALLPAEPEWPTYVARFLVHFAKGLFFGAGVFTMDRLLVTHQLQHIVAWIYEQVIHAVDSIRNSGNS